MQEMGKVAMIFPFSLLVEAHKPPFDRICATRTSHTSLAQTAAGKSCLDLHHARMDDQTVAESGIAHKCVCGQ
jgi:hypothetical protein